MDKTANPFLLPVSISVTVSPLLIGLLFVMLSGAILAIWISAAALMIKASVSLLALVYAAVLLTELGSKRPDDPAQIILLHDDTWRVITYAGENLPAKPGRGIFVHCYLVLLPLHYNNRSKTVILTHDHPDKAALRRLRVRLKYAC